MKKYLFLPLLFLVFFPSIAKAECEDSEIIRLQKLAKNVTTSYVYDEDKGRFTITLSNLTKDLIVYSNDNGVEYSVNGDLNLDNLFSGKHSYEIYASNILCKDEELATKNISLPYRNPYYNSKECKGIENYSYCNKWTDNSISYEIWLKKVTNYKKNIKMKDNTNSKKTSTINKIFKQIGKFYGRYYLIILPIVIAALAGFIFYKNKKDSLV